MPDIKLTPSTKSARVIALLKKPKGASLEEVCSNTGWQPHSARAFMTGLRKKGFTIVRDKVDAGDSIYRITGKAAARQKVKRA
jgi:predicted ArsR family transcriptional regulator